MLYGGLVRAHLTETPKHLIAMAASKKTAARGKVICATAKKEERRAQFKVVTQPGDKIVDAGHCCRRVFLQQFQENG